MTPHLPHRVSNVDEARRQFGDLVDRLARWFWVTDPLADDAVEALDRLGSEGWRRLDRALTRGIDSVPEAPAALKDLFAALDRVPIWVDRERISRAGRILYRAGAIGPIVLGARSLVAGYCSPAGNKPLVMTGRLGTADQGQRLAETGRFVAAVCEEGGLERGGAGFAICVRVRLMHAKVRRLIVKSGRWDRAAWGEPINQHDMLATSMLFSEVFVDGLRQFGLQVTPAEGEDWLHLWRWASVILGVDPELLPVTETEATRMMMLVKLTQEPPDEDSRRLVRGILEAPDAKRWPGGQRLAEGFCRALLGEDLADGLQLPRTPFRHAVRAASLVVGPVDRVRARSRTVERWLVRFGHQYWDEAVARSAEGPIRFAPPELLRG